MKPQEYFTRNFLLPELDLVYVKSISPSSTLICTTKQNQGAVCPKCACLSRSLYDKRYVKLKDAPVYGKKITLQVLKHRFFCKPCKRPFTEPLPGVLPRDRCTQRLKRNVYWACENFSDLKSVCNAFRVSPGFVYKSYYQQLELRSRKHNRYPFSSWIGIDEHVFGKRKTAGKREFVTMIVDHNKRRLRDVALGKSHQQLWEQLEQIPGRENVKLVTLDLSDSYKSFVKGFFPNAQIVADRFHVQRLINPILHQARIAITGDKRKNPARRLLNCHRKKLKPWERTALDLWLLKNPELKEIYDFKEAIARFYEIRGVNRAEYILNAIIARLELTNNKLLITFKNTLIKWRTEILNFFRYRLTNARVEGFNNVAKVIKRRAYGFRSFENYKLRLLNACS